MAARTNRSKKLPLWSLVLVLALAILVVRLVEVIGPERSPDYRWTIARIIDGDTVELTGGDVVRLLSIDTPERGEPLYQEAGALLARHALGKTARLVYQNRRRDDYGRLLAYLYIDTLLINKVIIDSGMGHLYLFKDNELDSPQVSAMLTAQRNAIKRGLGVWAIPHTPEKYYLRSHSSLRFHRPSCRSLDAEHPDRYQKFANREEALYLGLSPCRICEP